MVARIDKKAPRRSVGLFLGIIRATELYPFDSFRTEECIGDSLDAATTHFSHRG